MSAETFKKYHAEMMAAWDGCGSGKDNEGKNPV
jgi:hypothetical protein